MCNWFRISIISLLLLYWTHSRTCSIVFWCPASELYCRSSEGFAQMRHFYRFIRVSAEPRLLHSIVNAAARFFALLSQTRFQKQTLPLRTSHTIAQSPAKTRVSFGLEWLHHSFSAIYSHWNSRIQSLQCWSEFVVWDNAWRHRFQRETLTKEFEREKTLRIETERKLQIVSNENEANQQRLLASSREFQQ